ncbi:MAG TPA: methyltransferase domain-containing protein [Chloroflexaceae bacterium]|nr:methyltransferase domain-containing protein [Chloroflexaceae bacterium]
MTGIRAGGQDWLETWRRMYDAERAQGEAATDPVFARYADTWAGRAGQFAAASRRQPQPDAFMGALAPRLRPTDRVIDVGAGTGRYLPYLAAQVAEVIAVEPSPAMRAELERTLGEARVENVRIVPEGWPLDAPLAADVVLSAHVVYGVREVGPFLAAMDAAAGRLCALYLGLKHPSSALAPFWERVHGERRLPLPGALEAVAACHQLGLPARLDLVPAPTSFGFAGPDEALEELRMRLRITPDPARDAALLAAMGDLLAPTPEGGLAPREQQRYAGVVWWEPETKTAPPPSYLCAPAER